MKGAICVPTRGLVHSRTIEALAPYLGPDVRLFISHDRPIPDSFNTLTEQAHAWGAEYVWLVEEDVVPPPGTLEALLDAPGDIRTCNYGLGTCDVTTVYAGTVVTGTGCMLLPRRVLDALPRPWFRTDIEYHIRDGRLVEQAATPGGYGRHDVHLCVTAQRAGLTITVLTDPRPAHLRVGRYTERGSNDGCHQIAAL